MTIEELVEELKWLKYQTLTALWDLEEHYPHLRDEEAND